MASATAISKGRDRVPWSPAKIADQLFRFFITFERQVDDRTGHERSKYEKQGEFVLYRINLYYPPPVFVLHHVDLADSELEKELDTLDDKTLDDVMREGIYRLLDELNTSAFKIDVLRRNIRWEIK